MPDGKGLFLVVGVSGERSWVIRYKDRAGRSGRKVLGRFPDLRLADARAEALLFKRSVKTGETAVKGRGLSLSPGVSQASLMTVDEAYGHYATLRGKVLVKGYQRENNYRRDVSPHIGQRPLIEVDADHLIEVLHKKHTALLARGATGRGVGNLHAELSAFFGWCSREGRGLTKLKSNPMLQVHKPAKAVARDRWLTERELKWFLAALPAAGAFAAQLELLLRTCCRRGEIMPLTSANVVLESPLGPHFAWEKTKNGKPFLLPMTPQMVALLPPLDGLTERDGIWRSPRGGTLSEVAFSKPKERLDARMAELAAQEGATIQPWVLHDLRRSGATHMTSFVSDDHMPLIPPHVVEQVLNHTISGVAGVYVRHAYYIEKRSALTRWNDFLDGLR